MADEGASSLTRAIAILNALGAPQAASSDGLGVVQIAREIGREKSQVSRTLKTLAEAGFVLRDPETLRYRLGWRLFTLGCAATDQHLLSVTPHVLRQVVSRVRESAHLSVLEGGEVLTLMSESPARAIQASPWVGRAAPLYCTSAGRALLFDHTDSEVRQLLESGDMPAAGPNAPADIDEVLVRLRTARQRGYAIVNEEFEPGHVAVAAPVRDFRARVVAAVNVSAPKFRLGRSVVAAAREVKAAADHLSQMLCAAPSPDAALPTPTTQRIS